MDKEMLLGGGKGSGHDDRPPLRGIKSQVRNRREDHVGVLGSRRVYVGNLAWETTWQDLKDFFRQAGNVVYSNVMKQDGGRSQGCGIVEFETVKEARIAIRHLHDSELDGRLIFVREDREDKELLGKGKGKSR